MNYFYDKEADVFYFSQGAPRVSDEVIEAGNDVLVRRDPRTKKVRGFTLINASSRTLRNKRASVLPISFVPVS